MDDNSLLEKLFSRLEKRQDRYEEILTAVAQTQERHNAILDEHIRRTEILETELEPIKAHVALWGAIGKVMGIITALSGCIAGVWKLVEMLHAR